MRHLILSCICAGLAAVSAAAAPGDPHFEFADFQSWAALAPEVKDARPIGGATGYGYQQWANGQSRLTMPDQYRVLGDFDGGGAAEVAIPLKSGKDYSLLIARRSGASWRRLALFPLGQEEPILWDGKKSIVWDGKSLRFFFQGRSQIFITWDGRRFQMEDGALAAYVHGQDFSNVQLKVAPVDKKVPGLFIYNLATSPRLGAFGPEGSSDMRYYAVSSARLREIVIALQRSVASAGAAPDPKAAFTVACFDVTGPRAGFFQTTMTKERLRAWLRDAADKIAPRDAGAAAELRSYP